MNNTPPEIPDSQSPQGDIIPPPKISPQTIDSILEVTKLRVQNEAANFAYKEKELAANIELAKEQLRHEAEFQRTRPSQNRKSFALVGGVVIIILVIILGFLGWCMSMGKEQFVIEFIKYALYPASAGGGFILGRKSNKESDPKSTSASKIVDEAEVVS